MNHYPKKRMALAAGLLVFAVGCSSTSGGKDTESKSGTNAPKVTAGTNAQEADDVATTQPEQEEEVEETTTTAAPKAANPVFGDTYSWEDGLSISVGKPEAFTPSEYAMVEDAASYISFEVKIVNGTDENFDPSMFSSTLQSGNSEAEKVYDSELGFGSTPSTKLLPGREVVFKVGYGVSNPDDLVMEIMPDYEHDEGIFTS